MIELKRVKKTIGSKELFDIDYACFPDRGLVIIKGENGYGKTTLFNMLSLIDNQYEGKILYNGKNHRTDSDKKQTLFRKTHICYVLQKNNMISFLSVEDNQNIYSNGKSVTHTKISSLSQGQQEYAILHTSLSQPKDIYLLDEVLSSLDKEKRKEIISRILTLSETSLVILVSHDVSLEKYANQIYILDNKKLKIHKNNLKENEKKSLEENTYKINCKNICFSLMKSRLFSSIIHIFVSSLILFFVFLGTYTNLNDSFFYLVSGIKKQGYIILNCNHSITSKDIIRKFKGDCYYSIVTYPMTVQSTAISDSDNNYYCNQSFYNNMQNKNYPNGIKIYDYTYEYENQKAKIIIDNSIKEDFFIYHSKSIDTPPLILERNLFYDSDSSTKDQKRHQYHSFIFLRSISYLKTKYPKYQSYPFQENTFYLSDPELYSSKHVSSFSKPIYRSMSDPFMVDYNKIFPNGVDTFVLDGLDEDDSKSTIFLSDDKLRNISSCYSEYSSVYLTTNTNTFEKASYIANKRLNFDSIVSAETIIHNKDLEYYQANNSDYYSSIYSYSLMFCFFTLLFLFLESILYQSVLKREYHDYVLLHIRGLTWNQIHLISTIPNLIVLSLSFIIGGILTLTQTSFRTFFLSGLPVVFIFSLLIFLISSVLFRKKVSKHE